jgi:hypothetical protein
MVALLDSTPAGRRRIILPCRVYFTAQRLFRSAEQPIAMVLIALHQPFSKSQNQFCGG